MEAKGKEGQAQRHKVKTKARARAGKLAFKGSDSWFVISESQRLNGRDVCESQCWFKIYDFTNHDSRITIFKGDNT